jgi:hypothetical protein
MRARPHWVCRFRGLPAASASFPTSEMAKHKRGNAGEDLWLLSRAAAGKFNGREIRTDNRSAPRRIDRGLSGDKIPGGDPAAAPLGTDEEAAGTPPAQEAIKLAYGDEIARPAHPAKSAGIGPAWILVAIAFVLAAVAIGGMVARAWG